MIRLHVIAEGQTEGTFIDELIKPNLAGRGVYTSFTLLNGNVRYARVKRDIMMFMKQNPGAYCTTFIDYYGLGAGFPAKDSIGKFSPTEIKKTMLEQALYEDVSKELGDRCDCSRFIPYFQMHEFEALLFSDTDRFAENIDKPHLAPRFRDIRNLFPSPEDINDDKMTAPSKRIQELFPGYTKPFLGNLAALAIGLKAIRDHCPLFNRWLTQLEQLGQDSSGDPPI